LLLVAPPVVARGRGKASLRRPAGQGEGVALLALQVPSPAVPPAAPAP